MDSFKNIHKTFKNLSRNLSCSHSMSRPKGFFMLLLSLVLIVFLFAPANKFPAVTFKILSSWLHSSPNYTFSSSSAVLPEAHCSLELPRSCPDAVTFAAAETNHESENKTENEGSQDFDSCHIFDGHWVADDSAEPLYKPGSCPYVDDAFNCFKNGRRDLDYLRLRWKPQRCEIPRFDGLKMLNMMKGKRLVFVGDSLNRNMWESLVCSLKQSLENNGRLNQILGSQEFSRTRGFYSFWFKDFNCSIDFIKSPFLVQEWKFSDKDGTRRETLRLDMMQDSKTKYHDADIIIFNTGHWWTHQKTQKGTNYFQEGNRVYNRLEVADAYTKALRTWAEWVDANINSSHTRVFFSGYAASHFKGGQWNSGGSCDGETQPIKNDTYLSPYPWMMSILESVIAEMKTPVFYLNITRMTDYRKDGHPSIFRQPELNSRRPGMIQDCSHWCLPGVPDSWNELLFATLITSYEPFAQIQ